MEKATRNFSSLFQVSPSNGTDGKSHSRSRSRDISVDGSKEDTNENQTANAASFSKANTSSRGSSPSSKKKQAMEQIKKRSPMVLRRTDLVTDMQATPPTGRMRQQSDEDHDGEANIDVESSPCVEQDDQDGGICFATPPQLEKTKEMVDNLEHKIQKTAHYISEEQKLRDENVDEYLKLAAHATRPQLARIKAVFEKKNQKSAVNIQQLQKKLDGYQKKLREIDFYGPSSTQRQPKDVLRGMGHGLKRSVITKPKELAHMLKNRFGSADNIKEIVDEDKNEESHHGSATLPPNSGLHPTPTSVNPSGFPSGSNHIGSSGGAESSAGGKVSHEGSECSSSILSESAAAFPQSNIYASPKQQTNTEVLNLMETILQELALRREENGQIREEMESMKVTFTQELFAIRQVLNEDRYRVERLEEQINDLTELHQNEMENLKVAITDMEEKVQYQSEERVRDLQELVENGQTRISRMEHQQAQQQQQFLNLEGLENGNARALVVKMINILLTVLQVLLLIVATVAGILTPLLQTRARLVSTLVMIAVFVAMYMQLNDIKDTWTDFLAKTNGTL